MTPLSAFFNTSTSVVSVSSICFPAYFFVSATKGKGVQKVANMARSFGNNFVKAAKDLWTGGANPTKVQKYAGKALIGAAVAATVIGVVNTVASARKSVKLEDKNVFDANRKVVVD